MRNTIKTADKTALTAREEATIDTPVMEGQDNADKLEELEQEDDLIVFSEEPTEVYTLPIGTAAGKRWISPADAVKLIQSDEAKQLNKEIRAANGQKTKAAKVRAAQKRIKYTDTIVDMAKQLIENGVKLEDLGDYTKLSQPIHVNKAGMTIIGYTFNSPIGRGGARYYVNHSPKKVDAETAEALKQLGRLVSLAASTAAQSAGLEAMRIMAPVLGLSLNGLELAEDGDDSSDDAE